MYKILSLDMYFFPSYLIIPHHLRVRLVIVLSPPLATGKSSEDQTLLDLPTLSQI